MKPYRLQKDYRQPKIPFTKESRTHMHPIKAPRSPGPMVARTESSTTGWQPGDIEVAIGSTYSSGQQYARCGGRVRGRRAGYKLGLRRHDCPRKRKRITYALPASETLKTRLAPRVRGLARGGGPLRDLSASGSVGAFASPIHRVQFPPEPTARYGYNVE